eukprot:SAG31_NODE_8654_length_1413_cov_1.197869_2_plen_118_part_00
MKLTSFFCRKGDVFFSPSTTEALPLVYLEAMASGLNVCGPNAGGVPDTFTDGVEGYLFEPMDADSAVVALEKTLKLAEAPGRVAKVRAVAEKSTWEACIDQLLGQYICSCLCCLCFC